jgi:Mg2+/Co2+ transporter CorC
MCLMYVMYPIAYPTAKILDMVLGKEEGTTYKKAGLKTLVSLHRTFGTERLNDDEVTIITAVLDLKEKPVGDIMTPLKDVFVMSADQVMDVKTMNEILSKGYSRIPIHTPGNREDFIGMLLVKTLITYDPEDALPVNAFTLATLPETKPGTSALDILNYFQESPSLSHCANNRGKSHMVVVSETPGSDHGALGVVTLEDVIEELIGEEIVDETDVFVDVSRHLRRLNPASAFAQRSFRRISSSKVTPPRGKRHATTGPPFMRPLNVANEPTPTTSTKVTIKPGTDVRHAQHMVMVAAGAGDPARKDYGTNNGEGRTSLIEERVAGEGEFGGKVVISPILEVHDDDEESPLLGSGR